VSEFDTERETEKHGPDVLALLVGLATLGVSGYVLSDGQNWMPDVDARWLVAGGALLVGVILLMSSLRGRKR
jgi:hypothetical protein